MVTMSDIARKAGVSRPTVSVVLNQREGAVGICAETRQRVLEAASALGYTRNELARAVGTGKNRMFGFLAIAPQVEFVAQMMVGALGEAEKHGYTLKILRMHNDVVDRGVVDRCVELRLAGVVAVHVNNEGSLNYLHEEVTRHGIPLAILDSSFPHPWGIRVISDDARGAAEATRHLLNLGHRRIAYLGGSPQSGSSVLRQEGFRLAMGEAGLTVSPDDMPATMWDMALAEQECRQLLTRATPSRPTALLCASDAIAMVAIRTARRLGMSVPEDLSIVGYGDQARVDLLDPPLTTVGQPFYLMGTIGVRALLARSQGVAGQEMDFPEEHILDTRLIVRESTATVPTAFPSRGT